MTRSGSPKGRPQMPNLLRFRANFFQAFSFPASPYPPRSLPTLIPYLSPLLFHPALLFSPRRWTRNLAIANETCSAWLKHTNAILTANIHCIYPYASLYTAQMHNVLDLSLRPSVRSFVCDQLMNVIFRKRMNGFQRKRA